MEAEAEAEEMEPAEAEVAEEEVVVVAAVEPLQPRQLSHAMNVHNARTLPFGPRGR